MKRDLAALGCWEELLVTKVPIPFSPLLHHGLLLHSPPEPSQAVQLPNGRQMQYSTMRASLLAATALEPPIYHCPKGQREHLSIYRAFTSLQHTKLCARTQPRNGLPGLCLEQQVRH